MPLHPSLSSLLPRRLPRKCLSSLQWCSVSDETARQGARPRSHLHALTAIGTDALLLISYASASLSLSELRAIDDVRVRTENLRPGCRRRRPARRGHRVRLALPRRCWWKSRCSLGGDSAREPGSAQTSVVSPSWCARGSCVRCPPASSFIPRQHSGQFNPRKECAKGYARRTHWPRPTGATSRRV